MRRFKSVQHLQKNADISMDVRVFYLHLPCTPAAPARPHGCAEQSRRAAAHADKTGSGRSLPAYIWPSGPCKAACPLQGPLPPYGRLPRAAPPLKTFLRSFLFSDLSLCGEPSLFVRPAFLEENGFLMGKRSLCGRSVFLRGEPIPLGNSFL